MGGLIICRRGLANRGYDILMHHHALCAHHIWRPCNNKGVRHKRGPYHNGYHLTSMYLCIVILPSHHGYLFCQRTNALVNYVGSKLQYSKRATFPTTSHCHNKTMMPYYIIYIHSSIINLTHSSYSLCPPSSFLTNNTKSLIKSMYQFLRRFLRNWTELLETPPFSTIDCNW